MKKIGITLRVENYEKYNEMRDAISHDWVKFLEGLDIIPIFIPNNLNDIKNFIDEIKLDGIILSGGDNKGDNKERDATEDEIIKISIENRIPILGVCRGMQVINDYFGGDLKISKNSNHIKNNHEVFLTDLSFRKLLNADKIEVNSYHRNIIEKEFLGTNLQPFAISTNDNTIEGFFHKDLPIIGVMWHPERDLITEHQIRIVQKIFHDGER